MKMRTRQVALLAVIIFFSMTIDALASHIRGGQISVKQNGIGELTLTVTLEAFLNTESNTVFGAFDNGFEVKGRTGWSTLIQVPQIEAKIIDPVHHIGYVTYTFQTAVPSPGEYYFSYTEPNRNVNIINMSNSVDMPFHIESRLSVLENGRNATPEFLVMPIFFGQFGSRFQFAGGGQNINEDATLYYRLTVPLAAEGLNVENYVFPKTLEINHITGTITWDGVFQDEAIPVDGEFSIALTVYMIKDGVVEGSVTRDFQITMLNDGDNEKINVSMAPLDMNDRVFIQPEENWTQAISITTNPPSAVANIEFSLTSFVDKNVFLEVTDEAASKIAKITFVNTSDIRQNNPYPVALRVRGMAKTETDIPFLFYTKPIEPTIPGDIDDIISATEKNFEIIEAYPNPTHDEINFPQVGEKVASINVHTSFGTLCAVRVNPEAQALSLKDFPSGLYIITIYFANGTVGKIRSVKI